MGGAGLPLPLAFTAVIEDLLDNKDSDVAGLVKVIRKSLLFKERRVLGTEWESWESFAGDVLTQLESAGVIEQYGVGKLFFRLVPWFKTGVRHVIIPEHDIGVTVFGKDTRHKRNNDSKALMDLRSLIAKHPDIDPQAVSLLKDAVKILGEEVTVNFRSAERFRPAYSGKMKAPEDQVCVIPKSKRRPYRQGQTAAQFFRDYAMGSDDWFRVKDVVEAWNKVHPDYLLENSDHAGSMRKSARELLQQGVIETRMVLLNYGVRVTKNGVHRNINVQTAEYRRVK